MNVPSIRALVSVLEKLPFVPDLLPVLRRIAGVPPVSGATAKMKPQAAAEFARRDARRLVATLDYSV
jgi:hypothetical protein